MFNSRLFPIVAAVAIAAPFTAAAGEPLTASVLLRAIQEIDVPAREAGVLSAVPAREGERVTKGELLAQIEDAQAQVELGRATFEWEMASKVAENDVSVRFARKSLEVAEAELARATLSIEQYPKSVSMSEMDHLRLTVERTVLEIEQAEHKLDLADTNQKLRQSEVQAARLNVERRKIAAPADGIVAQVHRQQGEWVQPGDKVLRILRIDRLRAEGFIGVDQLRPDLVGSPVTLTIPRYDDAKRKFTGKIVFVSPETDPINGQIRIWAELENSDLRLRPGLRGEMTIDAQNPETERPEIPRPKQSGH